MGIRRFDSSAIFVLRFATLAPEVKLELEAGRYFCQKAFHRIRHSCFDERFLVMFSFALKTKTTMNETGAFNLSRNVVISMCLSMQLILWNAVWRKFLAASSMTLGTNVVNIETKLPHKIVLESKHLIQN